MAAALRDGASGAIGANPGSNVGIDRTRLYTPSLSTAGQQQIYGTPGGGGGGGYGNYPPPQIQQPPRQQVQNAGGVDSNYGSARIQTARSRMLGGSAMSGIMSPEHGRGGGGRRGPPAGVSTGQRGPYDNAPAPSTARSNKSQYALDLEQQMREKNERDRKARDLDRADGIVRPGSRVVSNLRNTVQQSRQMEDTGGGGGVNASRQRMLGGGAMADMLGECCRRQPLRAVCEDDDDDDDDCDGVGSAEVCHTTVSASGGCNVCAV